ncbi:MAG TPA: anti-sigma factor [Gemmatimonadota bacterium]|nr:anti-sigma factor [Gemmatimonadota bacterium]
MTDERFNELAAGFLLGDLDGAEAAELERELARRGGRGETDLRELRDVLGALALAIPPANPSPELKRRVMTAIGAASPTKGAPVATGSSVDSSILPLRRRPLWPLALVGGMAAALALWLGIANSDLRRENERLAAELASARERLAAADTARARLADLQGDLEVVAGPASSVHTLTGTGTQPDSGARARVFLDPATGRAILFAYDLPILPPDTVYELWAISGGTPRAAGVFRPDEGGRARLEVSDASLLVDLEVLAVTVEPAPGTDQPTSEPVLISTS